MRLIGGEIHGLHYELLTNQARDSDHVEATLVLSDEVSINRGRLPDFIESIEQAKQSREIELTMGTADQTKGSLLVYRDGEELFLPLLSAPVYRAVGKVIDGRVSDALDVLRSQYGPARLGWEFRNDCRDTLSFDAFVRVLNELAIAGDEFSHVQFRSRLGYFAKRIGEGTPQGIHSFEILEERVDAWNQMENLDRVELSEVLSERLCRRWFRDGFGGEREALEKIGFDPTTFDPDWETTLPASWIAHLVMTDSIGAAEDYVRERPTPDRRSYANLKSAAYNADYGERGPAWGAVVSLAVDPRNDDFRFDGYQYLRWTAEEYRGKGKIPPLLFAAARELAPAHLKGDQHQRLEFNEKMSIGHAWRRDGAFEQEQEAFEEALAIAEGETRNNYPYSPSLVVKATSSLAHARARDTDNVEAAQRQYDSAIKTIKELETEHDVDSRLMKRQLEFLTEERPSA